MSLVFGIVSPFVSLFYYQFVNPEIVAFVREMYQMKDATREMVIATDMSVQFLSSIIGGTIYAAIIAFFLKSKKK
jgi:uncharacterized protein YqgC (DUF456 family)